MKIAALFLAGAALFVACNPEDLSKPVITLLGDETTYVSLGGTFTDPGATALDDEDGDLTSQITVSGTVTTTIAGTYTLTYSVTDAAGNVGTETRTVIVRNDQGNRAGVYTVVDIVTGPGAGTYNYTATISASTTVNNRVSVNNFGGFGSAVNINMDFNAAGTNITIASQPNTGTSPGLEAQIAGSGNVSSDLTTLNILYTAVYDDMSGTDNGSATYTK